MSEIMENIFEYTDEDKAVRHSEAEPSDEDQRETLLSDISNSKAVDYVLQLPTGFGKCRIAIEILKMKLVVDTVLIVIPKLVLIDNWKAEFVKWGSADLLDKVTFTTYLSLEKHKATKWAAVIFDECHHLSEAAFMVARKMKWQYTVWLSATMTERFGYIERLVHRRPEYFLKQISVRAAIHSELLPDPRVYLMRMKLDKTTVDQLIEMNTDINAEPVIVEWKDRFKYFGKKNIRYNIRCTEVQYLENLNNNIAFARKLYEGQDDPKRKLSSQNYWLHLCGQRLTYLSYLKERTVKFMMEKLYDKRVVVFCSNIEQSERICQNSINSKRKGEAQQTLDDFNEGRINHISSCNMLNEGVNLVDCQYGVYAALNSSETLIKQKLGRLLRHDNPILIIPFYSETREEEIVQEMVQDYSRSLVTLRDAPLVEKEILPSQDGEIAWTFNHEGMLTEFCFNWSKGKNVFHYKLTDCSDGAVYSESDTADNRLLRMVLAEDNELPSLELTKFLNDYFKIPEALKKLIVPSKD